MRQKATDRRSPVPDGKLAPRRGPKRSLSTDQIARTAIRLADSDGLAALSMQRLAHEVGMSTMALYRYFPGKADLVACMIDLAGELPSDFGGPLLDWNARLKRWARECLAIYRRHPWFLEATSTGSRLMGPNELSWMEAALGMLIEAGVEARERHHSFFTLVAHVRGYATFQPITGHARPTKDSVGDLSLPLQESASRYPEMAAILHSGASIEGVDRGFEFGLDCILHGIWLVARGRELAADVQLRGRGRRAR